MISENFIRGSIPRGSGISYVAASFSEGGTSVSMKNFNCILDFDEENSWVEVESGCTLGQLFEFLVPRGYQLPVQPGYPGITIGGCIAGNVHGKNHPKEGVFGRHVKSLKIFHPSYGIVDCSNSFKRDLFEITIGGLGLTGVILSARLSVIPLVGKHVDERHIPTSCIEDTFDKLLTLHDQFDMAYAFMDLSRPRSKNLGRGFIVSGSINQAAQSNKVRLSHSNLNLEISDRAWPKIFNSFSMPLINAMYRAKALSLDSENIINIANFLFPSLGKESYYYSFGRPGFIEQQILLPFNRINLYLENFRNIFYKNNIGAMLATLKIFQGGSAKFLQYDGNGYSFTIDIPATPEAKILLCELDELNINFGAITSVLKDGRLSANVVCRQYPEYIKFKEALQQFNPDNYFSSELSRRLDL
jgi:decaprenylphospho-beta-D-ribofuranose 2-oxidase